MKIKQVFLPNEKATKKLAKAIGALLKSGDMIALYGDLGAGKTCFARAIIRFLMEDDNLNIPSPSFALLQPYQKDKQVILHVDLYRIKHPNEVEELGLFDDESAIIFIEWPQNAPALVKNADWKIYLEIGENGLGRIAKIENKSGINLAELEI